MSLLPSEPDAEPSEDAGPRVIGVDSEDAGDVLAALSSSTARELLSELHREPAPPSALADTVGTSVQNVQYHLQKLEQAGAIEVVDTAYSAKGREMDVYAPADQPLVIFAGDQQKGSTIRTALSRLLGAVGILGIASFLVQAVFQDGAPWAEDGAVTVDGTTDDGGTAPEETDEATAGGDGGDAEPGDSEGDEAGGEIQTDSTDEPSIEAETAGEGAETADSGGATEGQDAAADTAVSETVRPEESPLPGTDEVETVVDTAGNLPPGALFFAGGLFALALMSAWLYARG